MRFKTVDKSKYLDTVRISFQKTLNNSLKDVKKQKDGIYSVKEEERDMFTYESKQFGAKRQRTVYFAAGWFTPKQNIAYTTAMEAIKANPTIDEENSYVPLENQYKGLRVDEHPELLEDKEWQTATFNGDCVGIKSSDIFLCTYLPDEEDIGCGVELGLAKRLGKYIVLVIPDEDYGKPINLMSWGVADTIIKLSELPKFNFNKMSFDFYEGSVY